MIRESSKSNGEVDVSSQDNTFNFANMLDISTGKKEKTGQLFFKEAYDFDDFQNIGDDKTFKSSFYRGKTYSNIYKKQDQPSILNSDNPMNILENLSGTGSAMSPNQFHGTSQRGINQIEPQFGQRKQSYESKILDGLRSQQIINPPQIQGLRLKQKVQWAEQRKKDQPLSREFNQQEFKLKPGSQILKMNSRIKEQSREKNRDFGIKEGRYQQVSGQTPQSEYQQLLQQIAYFKDQSEKYRYERQHLEEESNLDLLGVESPEHHFEAQKQSTLREINQLNKQIDKQRAIQKRLTKAVEDLQTQYEQLVQSVNEMDFRRPTVLGDQTRVLIEQINNLRSEFEELQRDAGSLNLSSTIMGVNAPNSLENRLSNRRPSPQQQTQYKTPQKLETLIQSIYQENSSNEDSQFLRNLKLSCLKEEWTIFTNEHLQISVDYRINSVIRLRVGNKSNFFLKNFCIMVGVAEEKVSIMENEVLDRKSFLVEGIKMDLQNMYELFLIIQINYQVEEIYGYQAQRREKKMIPQSTRMFFSSGLLNFGQFCPLTLKEFQAEMDLPFTTLVSSLKPFDKSMLSSLEEVLMYFPNLRVLQTAQDRKCVYGLFMSPENQGTLVLIEEEGEFFKITLRNGNPPLMRLLEFILSV